jgi:uncharacterized protein involved in cysteine biosynthesis
MKRIASRFATGAQAPFVGFKSLYSGPRIFGWAIVPALVSSGLFFLGLSFGWGHVGVWLSLLAPLQTGFWTGAANWLLTGLGYILFVILLMLLVFVVSKIIVVPFNSFIAERVLKHQGVLKEKPFRLNIWMRRSLRMMAVTVVQTFFFVGVGALLVVLSFIPFLNLFVAYIGFIIVSFDCADYAMEIAGLSFKQRFSLVRRRLPEFCGFAAVMGLTFLVPFLNFLLLPISVSGASWLLGTFDEIWDKK